MPDGGMGSLRLIRKELIAKRSFKRQAAEIQFTEEDGVIGIASLNVD
jgi:hypothetical protein